MLLGFRTTWLVFYDPFFAVVSIRSLCLSFSISIKSIVGKFVISSIFISSCMLTQCKLFISEPVQQRTAEGLPANNYVICRHESWSPRPGANSFWTPTASPLDSDEGKVFCFSVSLLDFCLDSLFSLLFCLIFGFLLKHHATVMYKSCWLI